MTKFRHSSSFLISGSIYVLLIFVYTTLLANPQKIVAKKESVVKIAIITPPAPVKIEPKPVVVPPKPKPKIKPKPKKKIKSKPKKKPKPKPKAKPKPKPKPKKIESKPKPKPKKVVEEVKVYEEPVIYQEVYKEPIIEEVYQEPIREVSVEPVVQQITPTAPKVDIFAHKQRFKNRIRANIVAHKKYPRMAKRRRIEGTVHVVFDISSDGTVSNVRTSGASNLLQKAPRRSIEKSFPTNIPDIIIGEFPMRNVSINIDFILE